MKLRLDLLEHLTGQDIMEEVLANNHRYKPEPRFSKTGVGSLSPTSTEERASEAERSKALIGKLKQRAASAQKSQPPLERPGREVVAGKGPGANRLNSNGSPRNMTAPNNKAAGIAVE